MTGSRDKTIRQWDLSKLISHPESVTNLSELSFASVSVHETNGLSNVGDNCWLASLEGHSKSITCLYFENNSLVSLSESYGIFKLERIVRYLSYFINCERYLGLQIRL